MRAIYLHSFILLLGVVLPNGAFANDPLKILRTISSAAKDTPGPSAEDFSRQVKSGMELAKTNPQFSIKFHAGLTNWYLAGRKDPTDLVEGYLLSSAWSAQEAQLLATRPFQKWLEMRQVLVPLGMPGFQGPGYDSELGRPNPERLVRLYSQLASKSEPVRVRFEEFLNGLPELTNFITTSDYSKDLWITAKTMLVEDTWRSVIRQMAQSPETAARVQRTLNHAFENSGFKTPIYDAFPELAAGLDGIVPATKEQLLKSIDSVLEQSLRNQRTQSQLLVALDRFQFTEREQVMLKLRLTDQVKRLAKATQSPTVSLQLAQKLDAFELLPIETITGWNNFSSPVVPNEHSSGITLNRLINYPTVELYKVVPRILADREKGEIIASLPSLLQMLKSGGGDPFHRFSGLEVVTRTLKGMGLTPEERVQVRKVCWPILRSSVEELDRAVGSLHGAIAEFATLAPSAEPDDVIALNRIFLNEGYNADSEIKRQLEKQLQVAVSKMSKEQLLNALPKIMFDLSDARRELFDSHKPFLYALSKKVSEFEFSDAERLKITEAFKGTLTHLLHTLEAGINTRDYLELNIKAANAGNDRDRAARFQERLEQALGITGQNRPPQRRPSALEMQDRYRTFRESQGESGRRLRYLEHVIDTIIGHEETSRVVFEAMEKAFDPNHPKVAQVRQKAMDCRVMLESLGRPVGAQ